MAIIPMLYEFESREDFVRYLDEKATELYRSSMKHPANSKKRAEVCAMAYTYRELMTLVSQSNLTVTRQQNTRPSGNLVEF